jgi:hypothetical protein
MFKWLLKLIEDIQLARNELDNSWFILPPYGYPIEIYINPEWIENKKSSNEDIDQK